MSSYLLEGAEPEDVITQFLGEWDEAETVLGASRRPTPRGVRRAPPGSAPRAPAPRPAPAGKTVLKQSKPKDARLLAIGFDSVSTIAATSLGVVTSQPQVVFRPDRLVVPSAIAPDFLINDIKVGKNSQLISSTPVPAEIFTEDGTGVTLKMDTAQVSQIISLTLYNLDAAPHRFYATMLGPTVE